MIESDWKDVQHRHCEATPFRLTWPSLTAAGLCTVFCLGLWRCNLWTVRFFWLHWTTPCQNLSKLNHPGAQRWKKSFLFGIWNKPADGFAGSNAEWSCCVLGTDWCPYRQAPVRNAWLPTRRKATGTTCSNLLNGLSGLINWPITMPARA